MNSSSINGSLNSISVRKMLIPGMSLGTIIDLNRISTAKPKRDSVELVKYVNHWFSDTALNIAPIIQSPDDPTKEHPMLQQPVGISQIGSDAVFNSLKTEKSRRLYKKVIRSLEKILQNEHERKSHESENFAVAIIQEKNLSSIPKANRKNHVTVGMRGAIANKDLEAGTPIIYCAQYMDDEQWYRAVSVLENHLIQELKIPHENAHDDAERRMLCYSYQPQEFQSKSYTMCAYGAGNIGAMVNHDNENNNLESFRPSFLVDSNGDFVPEVIVYFATRDIKKGEQLLVDYGNKYKFYSFHEQRGRLIM